MKTILKHTALTAFLLILVGGIFSCKEKDYDNPIEIPFTEYSLVGTSCQWKNLNYDNKVIIINSNKDLEKYVNCMDGDNYPNVDFSKHTLLLISDIAPSTAKVTDIIRLTQSSNRKYDLKIVVEIGLTGNMYPWVHAILAPKISDRANIQLKIKYTD